MVTEPPLRRHRSWLGHGVDERSKQLSPSVVLERESKAKPRKHCWKPNHAFHQEEPKTAPAQSEFHPSERRNHSFKAKTDETKQSKPIPNAWKEIADLYLRRWTTHGQQATLQGEYDRGVATGKSWREIGAALALIIRGWERGR